MNLTEFNTYSILGGYPPVSAQEFAALEQYQHECIAELEEFRLFTSKPGRWFQPYGGVN